jgi:uncharacterized protein YcbX
MTMHIDQLFIYPVKSLRGFSVESTTLTPQGLAHDRQWMVINDQNKFITQRKYSQMILIHTAIHNDQLILSKPDQPTLAPLIIDLHKAPPTHAFDAMVWKDTCQVLDEGLAASRWLSQAIGIDNLRLVRMAKNPRPQSKPELLGKETQTYFADAAPFLVTNTASLEQVNQQLITAGHTAVPMENFRPNIVLTGLNAFAEHTVQQLFHPQYQLKHCYPCQRCIMPTVNIETGERHAQQQPFSLIADINAMPDNPKAPAFGENAILLKGNGQTIRVGDVLDVL